jgi:uncharacterized coiled-coil protein SlyX
MILTKKGAKLSDTKKYTELEKSIDDVSARVNQQAVLLKEVLLMMANNDEQGVYIDQIGDKVTELQVNVNRMRGRISDIRDDILDHRHKLLEINVIKLENN